MDARFVAADVMRALRLGDAAGDPVGHQFFMPFAASCRVVGLRYHGAVRGVAIRIYRAQGANPAAGGPVAGCDAVGHRDALAAFDQRQNIHPTHADRVDRLHR